MKTIIKVFIGVLVSAVTITACKQDIPGPVFKDNTPPGPVSDVIAEALPGAVRLRFTPPADADLLSIRARYTAKSGVIRETKVSRYERELLVEGFGDTSTYNVTVDVIDKSENISSAVNVPVHPLTPPVWRVRDSLKATPDFGGLNISFVNLTEANMAIVVLAKDSLNQISPIGTQYTNLKKGSFSIRGQKAEPAQFGVFVRDRWGNYSDTMKVTLTPLFEQLLDRTKMKGLVLPSDAQLGYGGAIAGLFDGNTQSGFYHSGDAARMPQWFTFDMGVTAKLSRLSWFMRPEFLYSLHNPKVIEIWGSNQPTPDGSFDASWVLLTSYTQVKPSGLPAGQLSQADKDAAAAGETVVFPLNSPKVRYIRFKTLQNWSNGTYVNFYELMLWGDIK